MRLGIFLALLGICAAQQLCNVGLIKYDADNKIASQSLNQMKCNHCSREFLKTATKHVLLNCGMEDDVLKSYKPDCATAGDKDCVCSGDFCSDVEGQIPENHIIVPEPESQDIVANRTCAVGLSLPNGTTVAQVTCAGYCANITASIASLNYTAYLCANPTVCETLAPNQQGDGCISTVLGDNEVWGCCCDETNCNYPSPIGYNDTGAPLIVCYSGFEVVNLVNHVNQNLTFASGSGWQVCQGECMQISYSNEYGNQTFDVYTCDPSAVCESFGIEHGCYRAGRYVRACCCAENQCINPELNPPKDPEPLICAFGVTSTFNNFSAVTTTFCPLGQCAALTGSLNGYTATLYGCVSSETCTAAGVTEDCASGGVTNPMFNVNTCCCDNSHWYRRNQNDSYICNAGNSTLNYIQTQPAHPYKIACFSGTVLEDVIISGTWGVCEGDCASMRVQTNVAVMGRNYTSFELYTCDPASVCHALNLENSCATLDSLQGLSGCCCNTGGCLDPFRGKRPIPLTCAVGVVATVNGVTNSSLAEVSCNGKCGSISGNVAGGTLAVYMCAPTQFCLNEQDDNFPVQIPGYNLWAYCCDTASLCNINTTIYNNLPAPGSPWAEYPVTCYSGIVNSTAAGHFVVSDGGWQSCNGECTMVQVVGSAFNTSIYTCDPSAVCNNLNIRNGCQMLDPSVRACCCNTNGCLDPFPTPAKEPGRLTCFVGVVTPTLNATSSVYCNGKCASFSGTFNGANLTTFHCLATQVCLTLEIKDTCVPLINDSGVTACCCDNGDYCNLRQKNLLGVIVPPPVQTHQYPITCWNGLYVNGLPVAEAYWQTCQGDCASIELAATVGSIAYDARIYSCDPSKLCTQLGATNNCTTLSGAGNNTVKACCCDTDTCIDPNRGKYPDQQLVCYVGVHSQYALTEAGAAVPCAGSCAWIQGNIAGYNTTTFHCAPTKICRDLEADNAQIQLLNDNVYAGCCDTGSYCNLYLAGYPNTNPPTPSTGSETPIACLNGIYVNGVASVNPFYSACQGHCVSLSFNTIFNGQPTTAELFTCDPTRVCTQFGMSDSNPCTTIINGTTPAGPNSLTGCCCSTDSCVGPNKVPGQFYCAVGARWYYDNNPTDFSHTVVDSVACNGQCASLYTSGKMANGTQIDVMTYHCVQNSICEAAGLYKSCGTIGNDVQVRACCCDDGANCNAPTLNSNNFTYGYPPPADQNASLVCPSGITLNGNNLGTFGVNYCNGECAAIRFNNTVLGAQQVLTLYTCDPSNVCSSLNIQNQCSPLITSAVLLNTSVTGCCCNTGNMCINGKDIYPVNPTTTSASTVGVFTTALLYAVYMLLPHDAL